MDIETALKTVNIDPVNILRNKIAHTKQAIKAMPELAEQFKPILEKYEDELLWLRVADAKTVDEKFELFFEEEV